MRGYELYNPKLEAVLAALDAVRSAWWEADSTVFNYTRPKYVNRIEEHIDGLKDAIIDLDMTEEFNPLEDEN